MADSRKQLPWICRLVAFTLLTTTATAALAGPGFIASSRVSKGTNLAEVSVRFNCGGQYLTHTPAYRGDQLRIQLESTGICSGVSPLVAKVREQHRPALSDEGAVRTIKKEAGTRYDLQLVKEVGFYPVSKNLPGCYVITKGKAAR